MATDTDQQTEVQTSAPTGEPAATQSVPGLFRWAEWVHVGPGAGECEERFTGRCENEDHFHAWCRMPNPFQIRDIAEKARAAKARRERALRDPSTDAYVILEAALDELRADDARDLLIDELLSREYMEDLDSAMSTVADEERFEGIQQHREELTRQEALPETERDHESLDQARKIVEEYSEAVTAELKSRIDPKREAQAGRSTDDLIAAVRKERIEQSGDEAYLHTYAYWQWFAGTMRGRAGKQGPLRPTERYYGDIQQLKNEPTDVVNALRATYEGLEKAMARADNAAGNS